VQLEGQPKTHSSKQGNAKRLGMNNRDEKPGMKHEDRYHSSRVDEDDNSESASAHPTSVGRRPVKVMSLSDFLGGDDASPSNRRSPKNAKSTSNNRRSGKKTQEYDIFPEGDDFPDQNPNSKQRKVRSGRMRR
jgi:hypothetical protein